MEETPLRKMYLDLSADHCAADDHAENLAGAFANLQKLGVTIEALDVKLAAVSVAAVDLDAVIADLAGPTGGEQLQLCGLHGDALALVLHLAGVPDHEIGGADLGCHIGELEADSLILVDGLAESGALLGILDSLVHGVLHETIGDGADGHTGAVQSLHRDHKTSALGADAVFCRDVDVVKAEFTGAGAAHTHLLLKLADKANLYLQIKVVPRAKSSFTD